jgi:hypothetical protein
MSAMRVMSVVAAVGIVLVSVAPAQAAHHRGGHASVRSARGRVHASAPRNVARAPRVPRGHIEAYPRGYYGSPRGYYGSYYGSPGPNLLAPLTGLATLATGLARPLLTLAAVPHSLIVGAVVGAITAGASYAMRAPDAGPIWSGAPIPYQPVPYQTVAAYPSVAVYPPLGYAPAPYVVGSVYAGVPRVYAPGFAVTLRR